MGPHSTESYQFAIPEGDILVAGADFETGDKLPPGWSREKGEIIAGADAPQGEAFLRLEAKESAAVRSPVIMARPGGCHFLSFWIKSSRELWITISFTSEEREPSFTHIHTPFFYPEFPLDTGDEWRQEGSFS